MEGILNLNKPSGITSFAAVSRVKHLLREKHAGHGGTLDPLASGVLPVFLGRATRVAEYLLEYPKTYRAQIEMGITTDTYDAEGRVISRRDASGVQRETLEAELAQFRGEIAQTPPVYSAIKYKGQPLHRIARRGEVPEMVESRRVHIYHLDLIDYANPVFTLEVECSRGTYIRSLAYDIGLRLGCGAYLKSLERIAYGPFNINNTSTLAELEDIVANGIWPNILWPLDAVLSGWDPVNLSAEQAVDVINGKSMAFPDVKSKTRLRAYDSNRELLALLSFDAGSGCWKPHKVFKNLTECENQISLDNYMSKSYIGKQLL